MGVVFDSKRLTNRSAPHPDTDLHHTLMTRDSTQHLTFSSHACNHVTSGTVRDSIVIYESLQSVPYTTKLQLPSITFSHIVTTFL